MAKNLGKKLLSLTKRIRRIKKISFTASLKRKILILLVVVILAGLIYYFKGIFLAGVVNGQPITRISLWKELESQGGKQTLDSMVSKILIQQEARKQGVKISDSDLEARIKEIEDQIKEGGSTLDAALAFQGQTRDQFREQIRLQLSVEKLLADKLSLTDEERKQYFEANKDSFPKDATVESVKTEIDKALLNQKISSTFQTWIADVKKKSKIITFSLF